MERRLGLLDRTYRAIRAEPPFITRSTSASEAMRITSEAGSPLAADGGPSRENDEGWARVDGGFHVKIRAGRPTTGAAREGAANAALAQCRPAAKVAHDLADQIAAPDASLATLAPKHVSARREARAACRVAQSERPR